MKVLELLNIPQRFKNLTPKLILKIQLACTILKP